MNEHLVIEVFLMALIVFNELRNYSERMRLVNRLLARDLTELASYEVIEKRVRIPDKIVSPGIEV